MNSFILKGLCIVVATLIIEDRRGVDATTIDRQQTTKGKSKQVK